MREISGVNGNHGGHCLALYLLYMLKSRQNNRSGFKSRFYAQVEKAMLSHTLPVSHGLSLV